MSIDERVSKLEKLVNALIKRTDLDKFYQDADIAGVRRGNTDNATVNEQQAADIDFIAMETGVNL